MSAVSALPSIGPIHETCDTPLEGLAPYSQRLQVLHPKPPDCYSATLVTCGNGSRQVISVKIEAYKEYAA